MVQLVTGALVMGYVVIGLFFLRFWKQSHDRLFGFFAAAFFVLAGQRLALAFTTETNENTLYLYLIRLLAFGLILFGILDKNRAVKSSQS
jgi:glucose uptake protein GlcU